MRTTRLTAAILLASALVSLSACGGRVAVRGNQPDPERIAELQPGQFTKQEISEILGSPSSVNTFGEETWYYISERTETIAFLEPEVKERQVLVIRFDEKDAVRAVEHLDLANGRQIAHVERVTPTFGQELTVIGQIIGNFQRFSGNRK